VSVDPPSIWPSEVVEPITGVVTFETGTNPTRIDGRFILEPSPPAPQTAAR